MARDYFSDIGADAAPHDSRSIRNIPINSHRPSNQRAPSPRPPRTQGTQRRGAGMLLWSVAFVAILLLLGVGAITVFRKTTIAVEPRTHTVVFDESQQYSAQESTEATSNLTYQYATVESEARAAVNASGTEQVEEFATGSITVYNDFQSTPLRLIKNTRFETPDGLVYRVRESIVVPGKTASGPGTLKATVFADQAGPEYNKGPVERFTLPALKTSAPDMYAKVYASSDKPFTGGYTGLRPVVAKSDLDATYQKLEDELRTKIEAASSEKIPADAFSFPQRMVVTFEDLPAQTEGEATTVGRKAIAQVPYVDRLAFARAIAGVTSAEAGDGVVTLPDAGTFTITLASTTVSEGLVFTLAGTARLVWAVDTIQLTQDLAGKSKEAFRTIIEGYPGIENAQAFMRPFWRSNFPENPEDMVVTLSSGE